MKKKGFTLIEIIVSTAIFTIVVTIAIGALTSLNKTSREARALRIIMDNANSAIDSMARTVRMGIRFDGGCDVDCACAGTNQDTVRDTGVDAVNVINASDPKSTGNKCLRFYGPSPTGDGLVETRYRYKAADKSVERSVDGGTTFVRMTAPEVEVADMRFFVAGSQLDVSQPIVTMVMKGVARSSNQTRDFNIETSIAPRTPNLSLIKPN